MQITRQAGPPTVGPDRVLPPDRPPAGSPPSPPSRWPSGPLIVVGAAIMFALVLIWADLSRQNAQTQERFSAVLQQLTAVQEQVDSLQGLVQDTGDSSGAAQGSPALSGPMELPPPEENQVRIDIVDALRVVFDPGVTTAQRAAALGGDEAAALRLVELQSRLPCLAGVSPVVSQIRFFEPDAAFVNFEVTGELLARLSLDRFVKFETFARPDDGGWVIDATVVDDLISAADGIPGGCVG